MSKKQILPKINQIVRKIAQTSQPEKIILFGSWAWGKPNRDSDVDLCIIKKTTDTRQEAIRIDEAASPRDFPLDILVYTPEYVSHRQRLGDFFINDILTKGQILYDHSQ